jgi:hypothetical protein
VVDKDVLEILEFQNQYNVMLFHSQSHSSSKRDIMSVLGRHKPDEKWQILESLSSQMLIINIINFENFNT